MATQHTKINLTKTKKHTNRHCNGHAHLDLLGNNKIIGPRVSINIFDEIFFLNE